MDKRTAQVIQGAIMNACSNAGIGQKFDVIIQPRGFRYGNTFVTLKFEVADVQADGMAMTKSRREFQERAQVYGLDSEDLGKAFTSRGVTYTITGLNSRATQFPIEVVRADGKSYKFPSDVVARLLGKS